METIKSKARRNDYIAWALIAFFVVVAATTFLNQLFQLLQNLGWVAKP